MIDPESYSQTIQLACPTCGCTSFECENEEPAENDVVKCVNCGLEMLQQALIDANQEAITYAAEKIGQEAVKDFEKELKNTLERAFGKNIKLK